MGEKKNSYTIFVGKPEGKTPLGRPRCMCVDNIVVCFPHAVTVEAIETSTGTQQ
jgi:hypothetical protein